MPSCVRVPGCCIVRDLDYTIISPRHSANNNRDVSRNLVAKLWAKRKRMRSTRLFLKEFLKDANLDPKMSSLIQEYLTLTRVYLVSAPL